jgi:hypothetical protein
MESEQIDARRIPATLTQLAVPAERLQYFPGNARRSDLERIKKSLRRYGQYKPIQVRSSNMTVIAGNHTLEAARELGWDEIAVTFIDVDDDEAIRINLIDNKLNDFGTYDDEALEALKAQLPDLQDTGWDQDDMVADLTPPADLPRGNLADMFGAPPFSVLDARQGSWRDRKNAWKALGIESELGRDGGLVYASRATRFRNWYEMKNELQAKAGHTLTDDEIEAGAAGRLLPTNDGGGTSIFDPVLTELMYRWFAPAGGHVLDPWAGGSVRGIVASRLGRNYTGVELRPEQVTANRAQGHLATGPLPEWIVGESTEQLTGMAGKGYAYDMVLGCPPYYDLESYSDDPRDLSNMSKDEFDAAMYRNVAAAAALLKDDRYMVFVVGGVRDKKGAVMDMRSLMIGAAAAAGLSLQNDAILLTPVGTLRLHAAKTFVATRGLSRTHQDILVFLKGDRKRAAAAMSLQETQATLETLNEAGDDAE